MSDPRNKINCAKCHNTKCTLSGKAFDMAACTGYKRMKNYEWLKAKSMEEMASLIAGIKIRAVEKTCEQLGYPFDYSDKMFEKVKNEIMETLNAEAKDESK